MKKLIIGLVLSFAMLISLPTISTAQVVVAIKPKPVKVKVVKPKAPSVNYIWIDGHYKYDRNRNKYVWVDGRWIKKKKGKRYVPGHWKKVRGGYTYVPGRWV
ncbi:MAG: hypothetical protein AAF502_14110 [Bacteroidota bacterium]